MNGWLIGVLVWVFIGVNTGLAYFFSPRWDRAITAGGVSGRYVFLIFVVLGPLWWTTRLLRKLAKLDTEPGNDR